MIYSKDRYPELGEVCTITIENYKAAALLFDRICVIPDDEDRPKVDIPIELTFGFKKANIRIKELMLAEAKNFKSKKDMNGKIVDIALKYIAEAYREFGLNVIPTYGKYSSFMHEFSGGTQLAFEAALNNINIVNAENLSWDHIIEFRQDSESLRKYRDLKIWFQQGINASSVSEATDIIAAKIDNYEWALKKHGMETLKGALTMLLDYKNAGISASAITGGTVLAGSLGGAIAGGLVIAGQTTAWLMERHIQKKEIIRGNDKEIAFIYDINNKLLSK